MYTRIFVAIDSSDTARQALDEAIRLASALGARLCIAHAEDEAMLVQHGMGIGTFVDIDQVKRSIRTFGNRLLEQAVATAQAAGLQAETKLLESSTRRVAELIADGAREWQADLIVVGTHGRRGVDRLLVGSVAENLTRLARTSLLLVRQH